MKAGDTIQVRQREYLPHDPPPVANPPIVGGAIDFWVYARVLEMLPDGKLRVRFNHPLNRWHGREELVDPVDVRSKADVEKLRDSVKHSSAQSAEQMKKHFQVQADRLS